MKIVVEKNPHYWDASKVQLNEMHFYPVSNVMTEDRMFQTGQLHLTSTIPSHKCPVYIEENNPDLRIDPYMGQYFYRLNTNNPALQDVRVRKALAYSIDRKLIVEKLHSVDKKQHTHSHHLVQTVTIQIQKYLLTLI